MEPSRPGPTIRLPAMRVVLPPKGTRAPKATDAPAELKAQLPPVIWGRSSSDAVAADPKRRFHLFTDGDLQPSLTSRYGPAAVGGILIAAKGKPLGRWGAYVGDASNNEAELKAILIGITRAARIVPEARQAVLVCHTDSQVAYRAIRLNEVHKRSLVEICLKIHAEAKKFKDVYFERRSSSNLAIRAAETQAQKALCRKLGITYQRRRGSKGQKKRKRSTTAQWNPFNGEGAWKG